MGLSSRDESLPVPHRVEIGVRLLIVTLVSKTVSATNETPTAWRMHWLGTVDAILLGRLTCDLFASLWPTVDPAVGATAGPRAALPKRVWGPRARRVGEGHAEVLRGGAQAATTVVPGGYPSTVVWGSPQLFEALLGAGLVDRLRLLVAPVLLGSGRRFVLPQPEVRPLRLRDVERQDTGNLTQTYELPVVKRR